MAVNCYIRMFSTKRISIQNKNQLKKHNEKWVFMFFNESQNKIINRKYDCSD